MPRTTERFELPCMSPGTTRQVVVHRWGPQGSGRAYIQASLHADEIPGLLVANHLCHMLDAADALGLIQKEIIVVPYANPIGLSQNILGSHMGRFSISTGVNFNRDWPDITKAVVTRITGQLTSDAISNVALIRSAILIEATSLTPTKEDSVLKNRLYQLASVADISLDLHCDTHAIMHMYTHDRLWPQMSDLAQEIGSGCQLVAGLSGGNPFDEACSCIWASLADAFPEYPIPMACQSATIELRGEIQVYFYY
jgi:predicted deacylase